VSNFALPLVAVRPFKPSAVHITEVALGAHKETETLYRVVNGEDVHIVDRQQVNATIFGSMWRMAAHAAATFAVILALGLVCLATVPLLLGYRPVVITSGSMEPSIRTADVVVTSATDGQDLQVGTVINFDVGDSPTLHRIVGLTEEGYRTAGDANRDDDSTLVPPDAIDGVGTVVVPFVGYPSVWLSAGDWFRIVLILVASVFTVYFARPSWLEVGHRW
jgi:signal peptidase I